MGFLGQAWTLEEVGIEANEIEMGLQEAAQVPLAEPRFPWGWNPDEEAEDWGVFEEDGEVGLGLCLDLKASSSPPEA